MSVRRTEEARRTRVALEGACPVEDAEPLAALLLAEPGIGVDWSGCTRLHTAVFQVLLCLRPPIEGICGDPFAARWLAPAITKAA